MNLRIYLIVEPGSDRVFVQSTYPVSYRNPQAKVLAVDVPLPGIEKVDGVITLTPDFVTVID
jgi:hypothetical protein